MHHLLYVGTYVEFLFPFNIEKACHNNMLLSPAICSYDCSVIKSEQKWNRILEIEIFQQKGLAMAFLVDQKKMFHKLIQLNPKVLLIP